ncbi:MAG: hypothetical protein ACLGH0_05670, partial [Thermoanaerobaculia bacterium]
IERRVPAQMLRRFIIDDNLEDIRTLPELTTDGLSGARVEWTGSRFVAFWTSYDATQFQLLTQAFTSSDNGPRTFSVVAQGVGPATNADGAWNGRTLVFAWTDRSRRPDSSDIDVYGAAANSSGISTTSPGSGFPIALSHVGQSTPQFAANGTESLLVWTETSVNGAPVRMLAAHATRGTVDTLPVTLSDTATGPPASVVFTGSLYLAVWLDHIANGGNRVLLRRVSRDGKLLDAEPIVVTESYDAQIAWNDTYALVTFPRTGIHGIRFDANGARVDAMAFTIAEDRSGYSLAMGVDGTDFIVAWTEGSDYWQFPSADLRDVFAARVSSNATILGGPIGVGIGPLNQHSPAVAGSLVTYLSGDEESWDPVRIETKKVLPSGVVLAGAVFDETARFATTPTVTETRGGYLLAWERELAGVAELRIARLDANGAFRAGPELVATSTAAGMSPSFGGPDLAYTRIVEDAVYGGAMRAFLRRTGEAEPRRRAVR